MEDEAEMLEARDATSFAELQGFQSRETLEEEDVEEQGEIEGEQPSVERDPVLDFFNSANKVYDEKLIDKVLGSKFMDSLQSQGKALDVSELTFVD